MGETRSYPGKSVNMILACKIVADHFLNNNAELSQFRTNWTPAYASGLQLRVDTVAGNYLGIRTRDELFASTRTLIGLLEPVKEKLALIKTQIKVDFKKEPDRLNSILTKLGFVVTNHNHLTQSALVAMLVTFKRNLTDSLIEEITSHGMKASLLTDIAATADGLKDANTNQETLKGTVKEATGAVVRDLKELYDEIIGICKIASKYYKDDAAKKELFTFSKILTNQGEHGVALEKKKKEAVLK